MDRKKYYGLLWYRKRKRMMIKKDYWEKDYYGTIKTTEGYKRLYGYGKKGLLDI